MLLVVEEVVGEPCTVVPPVFRSNDTARYV